MNYQWYPGHMTKARRMMQEDIKLIDLVIEITDARIPLSSRNPDIDQLAGNKSRILLLNKSDLADEKVNQAWKEYFRSKGIYTEQINAQRGTGIRQMGALIEQACKEKIERDRRRGILNRPVRAMICGIPNVGKSTFINSYAGKAAAKTGNKPGVTRGKQWIHLNKGVELLDTPGILWPKFEDQQIGINLAMVGSIKDELINAQELSLDLIRFLLKEYPQCLPQRFELEIAETDTPEQILEKIAIKRGCIRREGEPDIDRSAAMLLDDFRKAKLGRISLEKPPVE